MATGGGRRRNVCDVDFTPPVEMMVNDFDDERTLDEEEALASPVDPQIELSSLKKEGDMPLEDLMGMYGYNSLEEVNSDRSEEIDKKPDPSELSQLYNDTEMEPVINVRSTRLVSRHHSEDEDDFDFNMEEDKKKRIMVGGEFQAVIPEGLRMYDDALPYENEDKLLWNPNILDNKKAEEYLIKVQESMLIPGIIPPPVHIRDDEQALFMLLQCGHNVDEALRRRRINAGSHSSMSLWSEEEYTNFESGLKLYGKDFRQIQQHKVKTRSVGELVQFYYLWKKTERHDVFANKFRLEKKKYALHPGITDYMDRFLEEQDGNSSPNIQCLIYTDPKWKRDSCLHIDSKENIDGIANQLIKSDK